MKTSKNGKRAEGRMIRKTIAQSNNVALLSPRALSLFCLLIPFYNAHGKLNGNPYYIKGEIVPKIKWFTIAVIESCLREISAKTNVKWFEQRGMMYIHALDFEEHQEIRDDRRGDDRFPSYTQPTPGVIPEAPGLIRPEVEVEVEGEVEVQEEVLCACFDVFWKAYPRKVAKTAALKAWNKLNPTQEVLELMLEAIKVQSQSSQWQRDDGQYIPHPSTWLNQQRWKDETTKAIPQTTNPNIDRIIKAFKIAKGIPETDTEWNKNVAPKHNQHAQELLNYFKGDWRKAADCIGYVAEKCKGFEWGWPAVFNRAHEFKNGGETC